MKINKSIIFLSLIFLFSQNFSMNWDFLKNEETELQSKLDDVLLRLKELDFYENSKLIKQEYDLKRQLDKTRKSLNDILKEAISKRDEETVKNLIKKNADVNYQASEYEETPLMEAANKGYYNIAKDLIDAGANPDIGNFQGIGPLARAAMQKHENIIQLLIDSGANIYFPSLVERSQYGNIDLDTIEFIRNKVKERIFKITSRPILNLQKPELKDELNLFIENQKKELEKLISKDIGIGTIDIKDAEGYNPLHFAIMRGNFELAKWLLSKDSSLIKYKNNLDQTSLELGFGLWGNSPEFLNFIDETRNAGYINYYDIILAKEKVRREFKKGEKEFLKEFKEFSEEKKD